MQSPSYPEPRQNLQSSTSFRTRSKGESSVCLASVTKRVYRRPCITLHDLPVEGKGQVIQVEGKFCLGPGLGLGLRFRVFRA